MAEQNKFYEIKVQAIRVKGERDGNSYDFLSFEGCDKKGRKMRLKPTKDCGDLMPQEEGFYKILVNKKDISKDKSSIYNVYWVKNIEGYEEETIRDNDEDLDFFEAKDDDLPF